MIHASRWLLRYFVSFQPLAKFCVKQINWRQKIFSSKILSHHIYLEKCGWLQAAEIVRVKDEGGSRLGWRRAELKLAPSDTPLQK